jgi:acyl transferase domain-containing protein/NADPH:quinone reductase-like Zn-dependent oxidoreductase/NADP-dependent 3-hydroxy acid dehydrogenase YdfG/acyl carrier protein
LAPVHYLHDDIAVIGWSCRLPGANSVTDLWSLLLEGRCAISQVPADRFSLARYGHPRRSERGKSYTWAAGVLDDVWGFDPGAFGISPREAAQMDPQQRILLQLTWEALEDAGIRPSAIAGSDVGVFVGASQTDYGHAISGDQAMADSHFATGNALAILANRISYIYDLHGPSVTLDTACSSSLVALHHASEALRAGRIDTAIVGGINVIASPAEFVTFSQASMLSPTGLCRAFSADADGYVRGEGGVVLVLRKGAPSATTVHGIILASDVNSDGRTNGISLPSGKAQEELLHRVYSRAGIDAERLSFVEAHGTGTPAGDPIEANAVGRSLGRTRIAPLPIGSIKTNIGHLEPASGLAGMLKAMLALNHRILPRSLNFREPNPNIDFSGLNLTLCDEPLLLSDAARNCAGVNSFGFGGTNAHVVIAPGREPKHVAIGPNMSGANCFALSAASGPALVALARNYSDRLARLSDQKVASTASAIAHRRDFLQDRLVVSTTHGGDVAAALAAFIAGTEHPLLESGAAVGNELPIAFVYSGNGSQWAGMGISAYRHNAKFRAHFDNIDDHFRLLAGWSLKEALFSDRLTDRLTLTRVAQPLVFAIQSATTAALKVYNVQPSAVIGHSVGEVAAAEAAGILDLRTAVEVIYFRSLHQEQVRGLGRMAAILASPETVDELVKSIAKLEVAARNNPRATTVAGSTEALAELKRIAEDRSIAFLDLDLEYPFHTAFMAPIETPLIADLKHIRPNNEVVPFVSTVTGACLAGSRLGADYWWLNIREPVQFLQGIHEVAKLGARFFVEIGPRGMLLKHIDSTLSGEIDNVVTVSALERNDPDRDPIVKVIAKALISGAKLDIAAIFGADPGSSIALPSYPWQQQHYRFVPTCEAVGLIESERHPFSGARYSRDALEWYAHVDTALFPALADHRLGYSVIFPGTGFVEIALAVARAWLRTDGARIADCEILRPLDLTNAETREIMSRVSSNSSTLEIFSRPRLSESSWLLHCRCKILHSHTHVVTPRVPEHGAQRRFDSEQLYRIAEASGLHYGPAFRLVDSAVLIDDTFITVELTNGSGANDFVLDPIRLDACCHGLLTVFGQLHAPDRGVSYIPVRVDEAALFIAGGKPQSVLIEVLNKNDRSIFGNYYFFGPERELLAVLRGVRCQGVQVRRDNAIDTTAFVELPEPIVGAILGASSPAATADAIMQRAQAHSLLSERIAPVDEAELLIEGAATAAAYAIAAGLADCDWIDIEALVGGGRLKAELGPWLERLLASLAAAGLAKQQNGRWQIIDDSLMPGVAPVIRELSAKHSGRAAEIFILAAIDEIVDQIAASGAISGSPDLALSTSVLDFYDATSVSARQATGVLESLLDDDALWPQGRTLRVLQVGYGPPTQSLVALHRKRDIALTIVEPDRRRFDSAQGFLAKHGNVMLVNAEKVAELGRFDLVVVVENLHRLPSSIGLGSVRQWLAPRGVLLALEPLPSLFRHIVSGLERAEAATANPDRVADGYNRPDEWLRALERAEFTNAQAALVTQSRSQFSLIVAEADTMPEAASTISAGTPQLEQRSTLILDQSSHSASQLGAMIDRMLRKRGASVALTHTLDFSDPAPATLVHVLPMASIPRDAVNTLTTCCLEMRTCAQRFGSARATLWFVFKGALTNSAGTINPVATGAWAFARTLGNEFAHLDVRRIDIAPNVPTRVAAARLCDLILSGTAETELQIDDKVVRAVRAHPVKRVLDRCPLQVADAVRLQRHLGGGQRFRWEAVKRTPPGPTDIEIAVGATGLNFRDLMWMLSLLPDDMVEQGLAGPTLGFECAGEVIRVGAQVSHLRPGDRVAAFAAGAFATHVTVAADQAAKLPDTISYESGATIPVAFATAYYSLITQAKLKRREWVLIHGGAGGVGLAAIQIALARKARVIATAGSKAKRSLLKALGVHHVLDSRSTAFVEAVRAVTGAGVDVVLNSLAGEAMERSISCLREFGRFVELGKRDYVSNTHIGLRPFRNNISYFGVDLAQLMAEKKDIGRKIYAELMQRFESGALVPLPHSVMRACDLVEAFHLMQHSGHIGKIVVQPPTMDSVRPHYTPFAVSTVGTHVITGGFGGFGLAAAKWLVGRGARHIVLIGRRGPATEEATEIVAELSRRGAQICCEACDVADRAAVEKLFEKIQATMPPVAGVLHAAMVLDDALLSDLNEERFHRVLAPKVQGAENLDAVTYGMKLDYFVLFSSAVTLLGNPGQANYVAANAYMEGVARRRRQEGRTALAVGWGPITDVGVMARSEMLRSRFHRLMGVHGMRAADALDLMAQALALPSGPELAVITISPIDGSFTADRLHGLKSPTYANLVRGDQAIGEAAAGRLDLYAVAKVQGIEAARRALTGVIVTQLARVLHAREEEISRVRPLGEVGLDSLMALEFAMSLEESFGLHVTLTSSVGALTVSALVSEIICQLDIEPSQESALVKSLAERHFEKAEPRQLAALEELVEDATTRRKGGRN